MRKKYPRLRPYLVAMLCPLIVAVVMRLTWPFFQEAPGSIYLLAVVAAAWYGGLGPGLLSVLVSLLLTDYFLNVPYPVPSVSAAGNMVRFLPLVTVGPLVSVLSELMHRARRRDRLRLEAMRQSGEALHESEERLQTVIENLSEGLVISTPDGQLLYWNHAGLEMHGFKSLAEGRRLLSEFTHVFELSTLDGRVLDVDEWPLPRIFRGEKLLDMEVRIRRVGTDWERVFSYGGSIVHDASGRRLAFITTTNITERKHAEEALRELNDELEQRVADRTAQLQAANNELEAFSYSVSHDLRAPLRHVNGFSQALLEDYADRLDETGRGYLGELRGASSEMGLLIDDMLNLARVTRSEMCCETVNLSEMARTIVSELRRAERGREAEVRVEEGLVAHGDRRLLRIMLTNLLGNAWKFSAKRARTEISFERARRDESEEVFCVRDNGAGFDMAYADKLFGAFQRLHSGREFEGTGIGLATVQRIVSRHGGHIWAEGEVGRGAAFYFTVSQHREERDEGEGHPVGRGQCA